MTFARLSGHEPKKEETSPSKSRLPKSSMVFHEETKQLQLMARPRINIDMTQIPTLATEPSPARENPLQIRQHLPQVQAKYTIGQQKDKYEQEPVQGSHALRERTLDSAPHHQPIQKQANKTGNLLQLKSEIENLSLYSHEPVHSLQEPSTNTPDISSAPLLLGLSRIQAKLTVGAVGDKYEQEADAVAARVVGQINSPQAQRQEGDEEELQRKPLLMGNVQREEMPEEDDLQMKPTQPVLQRMDMPEEEEQQMKPVLQRVVGQEGGAVSEDLESQINSARGSGQSLAPELQTKMGQAMGADFSGVRVHTDPQSNRLNESIQAKAFTTGQDVFFRSGEYQPGSRGGQELIAHELTHVVQQAGVPTHLPQVQGEPGTQLIQRAKIEEAEKYSEQQAKQKRWPADEYLLPWNKLYGAIDEYNSVRKTGWKEDERGEKARERLENVEQIQRDMLSTLGAICREQMLRETAIATENPDEAFFEICNLGDEIKREKKELDVVSLMPDIILAYRGLFHTEYGVDFMREVQKDTEIEGDVTESRVREQMWPEVQRRFFREVICTIYLKDMTEEEQRIIFQIPEFSWSMLKVIQTEARAKAKKSKGGGSGAGGQMYNEMASAYTDDPAPEKMDSERAEKLMEKFAPIFKEENKFKIRHYTGVGGSGPQPTFNQIKSCMGLVMAGLGGKNTYEQDLRSAGNTSFTFFVLAVDDAVLVPSFLEKTNWYAEYPLANEQQVFMSKDVIKILGKDRGALSLVGSGRALLKKLHWVYLAVLDETRGKGVSPFPDKDDVLYWLEEYFGGIPEVKVPGPKEVREWKKD